MSDTDIRRQSWQQINEVMKSNLPDRTKLQKCLHISSTYAALTGDDSMAPPAIRAERAAMTSELPRIMKSAECRRRDKEQGMQSLF